MSDTFDPSFLTDPLLAGTLLAGDQQQREQQREQQSKDHPHYVSEEDEPNPIDVIAEELDADRVHLDSLRLDRRMNAKDYDFITRLPLSAKQLINILYELYPPTLLAENQQQTLKIVGNFKEQESNE